MSANSLKLTDHASAAQDRMPTPLSQLCYSTSQPILAMRRWQNQDMALLNQQYLERFPRILRRKRMPIWCLNIRGHSPLWQDLKELVYTYSTFEDRTIMLTIHKLQYNTVSDISQWIMHMLHVDANEILCGSFALCILYPVLCLWDVLHCLGRVLY